MNMKRYEKYKPSGIDWIGEVPEHWEVTRCRFISRLLHGMSYTPKDVVSEGEGTLVLRASNIQDSKLAFDDNVFIPSEMIPAQKMTRKGDIVICSTNGSLALCGKSALVKEDGLNLSFGSFMMVMRTDQNPIFIQYQLSQMVDLYRGLFATTTINQLTMDMLKDFSFILPPLAEQEAIAAYLDARCADIDKVVATQQKRIALLQELKQSEITQAVTRGLNPDARMKDSGVEWIGMVPEHWEKCRFKDFITLVTKPSLSETKIGLENIESGTGRFIETDSEFEGNGVEFFENDVVYGKLRPYLQKVWLATFKGNAVGDFFVFREKKNSCSHYLKYLLLSDGFTKEADGATVGAKMPRVSSDFILTMRYYLPNRDEQVEIAEYLDRRCGEIDKQIGSVTKQIELLREYKQALITEVVTGKRRV